MRPVSVCFCLAVGLFAASAEADATKTELSKLALHKLPQAKLGLIELQVTPSEIVGTNLQAMLTLRVAAALEEMKLFQVVDKIADEWQSGQLPVGSEGGKKKLSQWLAARPSRLDASARRELLARAVDPVLPSFAQGSKDSSSELLEFAAVVKAISESADAFKKDNVSPSSERDTLAERAHGSAKRLGLALSNQGYGAAHYAAEELAKMIRDALALLDDPAIQSAFGGKDMWKIVEERSGVPGSRVAGLKRRAEAETAVLTWLADHVKAVREPNALAFAKQLSKAGLALHAKELAAVTPSTKPSKTAPLLCLDAKKKLVPCKLQSG
ncbi:MAG: hypothetical protein U0263_09145 [Polyangiaceae bacterium]